MVIRKAERYFYVCNGDVLKDLDELLNAVENMDDQSLAHHFNSEKNDFAEWVRKVLRERDLANKLKYSKTREEMAEIIRNRINTPTEKERKKEIIESMKEAYQ